MLYKIDYTARSKRTGTEATDWKWVKNAADQTEAVTRFMNWFFANEREMQVRLDGCTEVEFIGDLSAIDTIDSAIASRGAE